ncbi:MAG TPA: MerR family transcriptional regulator [Spirochaetota bacterium]|nr:MerR family transcriptional regulator [Spirochaetota bacterium]HNT11541.1 MerR family transcriptional regulator [Spirochaetota bacterium]HNV45888.1 MerR family transcriptional regulator [Spirochaetota bacterium]HPI22373.1 MerR family transcriptional regulator [Spirochaetota bacterium]HPU88352.1 MerR family transcriptional regulator [Spirochaetota bacterium]
MPEERFTISELAEELDINPSTIRFYEQKGLLLPERTRGNQRVYTRQDRGRLKLILRGKRFGATLDQIAEMIGMADEAINEMGQIDTSLYYIDEKMKEVARQRSELDLFQADLEALKRKLNKRRRELMKK